MTFVEKFAKAQRAVAAIVAADKVKPAAPRWKSKREMQYAADVMEGERVDGTRLESNRVARFICKTWSLPVACKFIRQARRIGKGRRG